MIKVREELRRPAIYPPRPLERKDNGYFGPGSLTWEIMGHPSAIIGAARNTVYSALIPEVSQALIEHGKTLYDPISRAEETAYALYSIAFGDTAEAQRAGRYTLGKHKHVNGTDPVTGSEYSPLREDLAVDAHGIIWESNMIAYETYVRQLSDIEREQYWREGFIQAELIGIDPAVLPQTWAAWRQHLADAIRPRFCYSAAAEKVVSFRMGGSYVTPTLRPAVLANVHLVMELVLATVSAEERALFGRSRSGTRIAVTRRVGAVVLAASARPPLRDRVESVLGPRAHELLAESRRIQKAQPHNMIESGVA